MSYSISCLITKTNDFISYCFYNNGGVFKKECIISLNTFYNLFEKDFFSFNFLLQCDICLKKPFRIKDMNANIVI